MRKIVGILLVITALLLSGCQKEINETEAFSPNGKESNNVISEKEKKPELDIDIPKTQELVADYTSIEGLNLEPGSHIAVVVMNPKVSYWKAVEKGIKQAVADLNEKLGYTGVDKIFYTYEGPDDDKAAEAQINIIDAVLAENPQALCIAAIDMNSCEAQLETAQENGIPVIILDSGVKSDELVYTICETDNYSAGVEAAKKLSEKVGDSGKIQIVAHIQNAETSSERELGFRDEITNNHPEVQLLDTIYEDGEGGVAGGLQLAIQEHPDLKGCFATSEGMSVKMLNSIEKQKANNLVLIGFDAGTKQLEAIRSGKEYGVICQNPHGMGYATVIAASRAVLGMKNDDRIDAGYQWIDADNIDAVENQKYLYE